MEERVLAGKAPRAEGASRARIYGGVETPPPLKGHRKPTAKALRANACVAAEAASLCASGEERCRDAACDPGRVGLTLRSNLPTTRFARHDRKRKEAEASGS